MAVPAIAFTQVSELWMSVALLAPAMFFASFPMPAPTAAMQILPPNQMRAQISALFLMISNLIGLGLGTTLVALLTDRLFHNPAMVGSSISLLNAFAVALTLLLLIKGCRHFRESLKHEGLARRPYLRHATACLLVFYRGRRDNDARYQTRSPERLRQPL
jgi:hypothetical protein